MAKNDKKDGEGKIKTKKCQPLPLDKSQPCGPGGGGGVVPHGS